MGVVLSKSDCKKCPEGDVIGVRRNCGPYRLRAILALKTQDVKFFSIPHCSALPEPRVESAKSGVLGFSHPGFEPADLLLQGTQR